MNQAAAARIGPWADALSNRGHDVLILTSKEAGETGDSRILASRRGVPSNQSGLLSRFWQEFLLGRELTASLKRLPNDLDCVVITSPPFFMASMCCRAAFKMGVPFVFDVRDRYPDVLFQLGVLRPRGIIGRCLSYFERKIYQEARLVTTVTKSLRGHLSELTDGEKVLHVPNGFDESLFSTDLLKTPKRETFTVVYHGRFSRLHDVEALRRTTLEVQLRKAEVRFLIIGPIPNSISEKDWGNTEFHGETPREDIPGLLAPCHLGVSLMKTNQATTVAFPAKVFEYLGAGLPVLASPEGEMTKILQSQDVGIVFSQPEPVALAEALINLANDRQTYDRLSANVRAIRLEMDRRMSATRFVESLENLFLKQGSKGSN